MKHLTTSNSPFIFVNIHLTKPSSWYQSILSWFSQCTQMCAEVCVCVNVRREVEKICSSYFVIFKKHSASFTGVFSLYSCQEFGQLIANVLSEPAAIRIIHTAIPRVLTCNRPATTPCTPAGEPSSRWERPTISSSTTPSIQTTRESTIRTSTA